MSEAIEVRGGATVEELAVVLATLQRAGAPSPTALTPYDQWRRRRIAAIHPHRSQPPG